MRRGLSYEKQRWLEEEWAHDQRKAQQEERELVAKERRQNLYRFLEGRLDDDEIHRVFSEHDRDEAKQ